MDEARFESVLVHLDGFVRLNRRGDIDLVALAAHATALAQIVDLRSRVELDLGDVDFIDSSGLAFLLRVARAHHRPLGSSTRPIASC